MELELTKYDPIKAAVDELEKVNAALAFDYRSPDGNKNARSHIWKMRTKKADIERARKELNEAAQAHIRKVNGVAKEYTAKLDAMILVHQAPIDQIEAEEKAAALEAARIAAEAKAAEDARLEAERQAALEIERQKAAAAQAELEALRRQQEQDRIEREAAEKARQEAEAKAIRERQEAEAKATQEREALLARERAAQQAKLDAEREAISLRERAVEMQLQAIADAKAAEERSAAALVEAERQAKIAAEQRERDRIAAEEKAKQDAIEAAAQAERDKAEAVRKAQENAARQVEEARLAEEHRAAAEKAAEEQRRQQVEVRQQMIAELGNLLHPYADTPNPSDLAAAIIDNRIPGLTYTPVGCDSCGIEGFFQKIDTVWGTNIRLCDKCHEEATNEASGLPDQGPG
jgi:hypothetical protein